MLLSPLLSSWWPQEVHFEGVVDLLPGQFFGSTQRGCCHRAEGWGRLTGCWGRAQSRQGSGLELCLLLGSWMWQVSCGLTWLAAQCLAPGAFEFCAMCDLSVVCSESESLSCWLAEGVTSNTSDSESSSSKCVSFSPMSCSSTVCPHHPHSSVARLPFCSEATASFSHVHLEILEMLWPFCPVWWGLGCGSQENRSPAGLLGTQLKSSPRALGGGAAREGGLPL